MSAVTQIINTIILLLVLANLSACSDGAGTTSTETDNRFSNLDTPFTILEGDSGEQATLTVSFTSAVTGTISYSTFNVTAAEKSDYISSSDELTVVEGEDYTIDIDVIGDDQIEGNELIGVSISQSDTELDILYGLIINDDLPPLVISTTTVLEGDAGSSLLTFTFELQDEVVDPYTFLITTPEESTLNNDPDNGIFYAIPGIDFESVNQSITFTSDETEISIDVVVFADNIIELDERVKIVASSSEEQGQGDITAVGVIKTDDSIDDEGFDFTLSSGEQNEGSSSSTEDIGWGQVSYTIDVNNSGNIIENQTIEMVLEGYDINPADGWAAPGLDQDYCANNPEIANEVGEFECNTVSTYVLEPNASSLEVSLYIREDLDVESGSEDIRLVIQNDQGVTFGEFFHSIKEDDYPVIMVTYNANGAETDVEETFESLMASGITVNESIDDSYLTLSLDLQFPQTITYFFDYEISNDESTDIDSSDYGIVNGEEKSARVTIDPNQTDGVTLEIGIYKDSDYEGEERFSLEIDGIGTIPISIIDNDLPGLEIVSPTGDEIEIDNENFEAIKLDEQLVKSSENSGGTFLYDFDVSLAENYSALSSLNLYYNVNTDFFLESSNVEKLNNLSSVDCTYLFDAGTKRQALYSSVLNESSGDQDFRVLIDGEIKNPGDISTISIGDSSARVQLEINNDEVVECLEFLSLNFVLEPTENIQDIRTTKTQEFEISNNDMAVLAVQGWQVDEGSSLETPPATTDAAFSLILNQSITTELTYSVTSSGDSLLGCAVDDISNLTNSSNISFSGNDELAKDISINVLQDEKVEPSESCLLSFISSTSDLVDIQYYDVNLDSGELELNSSGYAQGVISNDDLLDITVTSGNITEPLLDGEQSSVGTYAWNKDIAANVGAITIKATSESCDAAADCVESTDTNLNDEQGIVIHTGSETDTLLKSATPSDLPIYINDDNVVEAQEQLKFSISQESGEEYINSIINSDHTVNINNSDKLELDLSELLVSANVTNNGESGSRSYSISWSDQAVSDTVGEINLTLQTVSDAIRKTNSSQTTDDYEYVLQLDGDDLYGNTMKLKSNGEILSESGSIQFNLLLNDDSLVELEESIEIIVSSLETDFVEAFSGSENHLIEIDDKLIVSLTPPGSYADSALSTAEADEGNYDYEISWSGEVASNVPELFVDISQLSTASIASDYSVTKTDSKYSDDVYKIKEAGVALSTGSDGYLITIIDDAVVEIDESINTTLQFGVADLISPLYVDIEDSASEIVSSITLEHTITDTDTSEISLTHISGDTLSSEESAATNTYQVAWSKALPAGLDSQTFTLPFTNSAVRDADFTVASLDASLLTISGNTFTIVKATDAELPAGSAQFSITIINDTDIEVTEYIDAELTGSSSKLAISATDYTLSQTITDIDKTALNLTLVSGSLTSSEVDENTNTYALTWGDDIPAGAEALTVSIPFLGTAVRNTDYSVAVVSSSNGKLSISDNVFTIIKNTNSVLNAGSVQFELTVINDADVEITETITAEMSLTGTSGDYVSLGDKTLSHSITDQDTATLSLTGGSASSNEDDEATQTYTLSWDKSWPAGVESQSVSLSFSGTATKGSDYTVQVASGSIGDLVIDGDTFTISKDTDAILDDGSVQFEVVVDNDTNVEVDESISATMSSPASRTSLHASNYSLSHTINDGDQATLSLTGGSETSKEADESTLTYTLAWDQILEKGIDSLTVELPFSGTAEMGELKDYTVNVANGSSGELSISGDTYTIVKNTDSFLPVGSVQFEVVIKDDTDVEATETIAATLGSPSTRAAVHATEKTLSHNITDIDTATLTLIASADAPENSGGAITYTLAWDENLGKGIQAPTVNIAFTGTVNGGDITITDDIGDPVTSNSDALTIAGSTLTIVKDTNEELGNGNAEFTVTVINEKTIEYDETIIATLSSPVPSDKFTVGSAASYVIENDDQITLQVVASDLTEPSVDTGMYVIPTSPYTAEFSPTVNFALIAASGSGVATYGDGNDFTYQTVTLPIEVTQSDIDDVADNINDLQFLTVKPDDIIEVNETIPLTISTVNYLDFTLPTLTINNNDYLEVSTKYYDTQILNSQVETTQLQEPGQYTIEFCLPTGYSIETDDGNLEFTTTYSVSGLTGSEFLAPITDSDISVLDDSATATTYTLGSEFDRSIDLDTLTSAASCVETPLINAVDNSEVNQNKSFFTDFASDDVRCNGSCLDQQFLTIVNDDLINVLDTGLVECVERGTNQRWDVPCSGDNSHVPDATHNSNYQYQDGAVTDFYPELSFTYIDGNSNPVQEKPTDNDKTCFQDNSTGLIWSPSSTLKEFSDSVSLNDCDLTDGSWIIPSVHELITIMDLNPLSDIKPLSALNNLNLGSTGSEFWSDHSRYWSSDSCSVDAITGQWAVDFISGHIECVDTSGTETNYFMKVYK